MQVKQFGVSSYQIPATVDGRAATAPFILTNSRAVGNPYLGITSGLPVTHEQSAK